MPRCQGSVAGAEVAGADQEQMSACLPEPVERLLVRPFAPAAQRQMSASPPEPVERLVVRPFARAKQQQLGASPWLSVILPAYNEAGLLAEAVEAHLAVLKRLDVPGYEIVVVDDGSQDETAVVACRLAASCAQVKLLRLEQNVGQAVAILAGFAAACGRWVLHNGVDLPLAPTDLPALLELLVASDAAGPAGPALLVVERRDRTAYGWQRKLLSWANVALVRLLFRSPVRDHNFVQFYRRDLLAAVRPQSRGASTVTLELIVRGRQRGFGVLAVQVGYRPRRAGASRLRWRTAWHAFWQTLRLRWLLWQQNDGGRR